MEIEVLLKRDIDSIITKLIETGICDDSNYPSIHTNNNIKYVPEISTSIPKPKHRKHNR